MNRSIAGVVLVLLLFSGCKVVERFSSDERKANLQQERLEREHHRQYKKAKERHVRMQSRTTIRNMQQNRQKSKEWQRSMRRAPFFVRWFQSHNK